MSSTVCDLNGIWANVFKFSFSKSSTLTNPSLRIFKFNSEAIWRKIRVLNIYYANTSKYACNVKTKWESTNIIYVSICLWENAKTKMKKDNNNQVNRYNWTYKSLPRASILSLLPPPPRLLLLSPSFLMSWPLPLPPPLSNK